MGRIVLISLVVEVWQEPLESRVACAELAEKLEGAALDLLEQDPFFLAARQVVLVIQGLPHTIDSQGLLQENQGQRKANPHAQD